MIVKTGTEICPDVTYIFERSVHVMLTSHVDNNTKSALHCLRSSAATAVTNTGINDRLFKRHER